MNDHLGVAARVEYVAERLQLRDQLLVVVDLAVEDDDDRAVLVVERLLARGEVDDRQSAVAKPDARLEVQPLAVRTAMRLRVVHALQQRAIEVAACASVEEAGDAAHR